jgi:RHS repeat-associated protein
VLGHLSQETTSLGVVQYTYNALGRRTLMSVTGQPLTTYSYDGNARLTQILQGSQVVDFAYDALGHRTRLILPNGVTTDYSYDAASRLTELVYQNATGILGNLTYQYDSAGNRTAVYGTFARTLLSAPIASASYDMANRPLQFGTTQRAFDTNGNLISVSDPRGSTLLTWDARNRLVSLISPGMTAAFQYDAFTRRVTKAINGQSTSYLYDSLDAVQELANGGLVNSLRSLNIDERLIRDSNEHFLTDALGSSIALTDSNGAVHTEYTYEPYGGTTVTGSTTNSFQYTNRENDQTGLYYYRARYYDPRLGRFISEDPIRFAGGLNFYTYLTVRPFLRRFSRNGAKPRIQL